MCIIPPYYTNRKFISTNHRLSSPFKRKKKSNKTFQKVRRRRRKRKRRINPEWNMLILSRKGLRVQRLETAIERERDGKLRGWTTQPWKTCARQEKKNSPDSRAGSAFGNQRETLTLLFGIGERLVDLHVAHTFLFKENKEVGSIGRGEPIVTLRGRWRNGQNDGGRRRTAESISSGPWLTHGGRLLRRQ